MRPRWKQSSPRIWAALRDDLYVDDLLTGADQITEPQQIKDDTVNILAKAWLRLTKVSKSKKITKTSENEVFLHSTVKM